MPPHGGIYFGEIDEEFEASALIYQRERGFGAMNEARKSTKYFSERMNGGGFSRYPSLSAIKIESKDSIFMFRIC